MDAHQYTNHASSVDTSKNISRRYAWLVFALTFGLLISDYMSRQVLISDFSGINTCRVSY